jgi:hypothetical protein
MKTVTKTKNGVMVLGMHHLGMSMLSGLLVQQFGYIVGKLLIGTGPLNPETKGHFELPLPKHCVSVKSKCHMECGSPPIKQQQGN